MKRFTVSQAKDVEGRDKPIWLRHGIAFQKDDKPVRIKLESLPVANRDGEIWLTLFEETGERSQGGDGFTPSGYDQSPIKSNLDDDVPW